jgi:hypothetical protein
MDKKSIINIEKIQKNKKNLSTIKYETKIKTKK